MSVSHGTSTHHELSPFVIHHGPHGYLVHISGVAERAAIDTEYEEMLARLCKFKDVWCLPKELKPSLGAQIKPKEPMRGSAVGAK
jgi:hypothetical protein